MKWVITWHERDASPVEYERAKNGLLEVFKDFKLPKDCKVQQCLVRTGEFGGYVVFEAEGAGAEADHLGRILNPVFDRIHQQFRVDFQYKIDPVVDMTDAVVAYVT